MTTLICQYLQVSIIVDGRILSLIFREPNVLQALLCNIRRDNYVQNSQNRVLNR